MNRPSTGEGYSWRESGLCKSLVIGRHGNSRGCGSLYLEKGSFFEQIEAALPERSRGYLKALIAVQLKIQGYDMVQEMLDPILDDLYKAYPVRPLSSGIQPKAFFYEHHVIKPWITTIERMGLLEAIAARYPVDLFSHTKDFSVPSLCNHGQWIIFVRCPWYLNRARST